jgi:hypothetical protein
MQIDHAIVYPVGFDNKELEEAVNVALTEIKDSGALCVLCCAILRGG